MPFDTLVIACLGYVAVMFAVAFAADRAALRGKVQWLDHPAVYTLSLSVYCSAWTFYGAVGYASRSGLEFATIYLGPTIVFTGAWWGLRRLVRVARVHHVTSVADMVSARFGKSNPLAALITLIAVVAATPYIALQLQSVSMSFDAFAQGGEAASGGQTALWVAVGLALFTILFGTRNLGADERHHGVVTAIALEAVVKLLAFIALGVFVVWGLADGPGDILRRLQAVTADPDIAQGWLLRPDRWTALIIVSGAAVVTLPRMFQVMVVEAADEDRMRIAGWAFPAYLFAMSLFVLPIALVGRDLLPAGSNPDLYVLTLPASQGQDGLSLLVFLGGVFAATSMVVVSAIALATMISNHWLVPIWLWLRRQSREEADDLRGFVLNARRLAILGVMGGGWAYHQASGGTAALASMGLVAFSGMAQVLPAMLGGLLWRGANRLGAYAGVCSGLSIWLAFIFLPSLGIGHPPVWPDGIDHLAGSIVLSLSVNILAFLMGSLWFFPGPIERMQGLSFVYAVEPTGRRAAGAAGAEPLLALARRVWGADQALRFFQAEAVAQGKTGYLPDLTPRFLTRLERRLAGSVGAATAHAMIDRVAGGAALSVSDLMNVAGEAQRAMEETRRLESATAQLERTARQLREANEKLTDLSVQKDAFLGQISHELRTPMTSIRAFSEILKSPGLPDRDREKFAGIIHQESGRLTRLLDALLDLSVLESGRATLNVTATNLHDLLDRALSAASATRPDRDFLIERDPPSEHVPIISDPDRLLQVLINLISNARKYCDADRPRLTIRTARPAGGETRIDIIDNGSGIDPARQHLIFEKFSRLNDPARAGGAGLGLAICREIMTTLGGAIDYLPGQGGAAFRVTIPRPPADGFARGGSDVNDFSTSCCQIGDQRGDSGFEMMADTLESGHSGQGAILRGLLKGRNAARAGAGGAPALPVLPPATPARAAAAALGRAADAHFGLPAKTLEAVPGAATLAELSEILPDPALFAVVQGPADAVGVVALCPDTVATLIEMQALGRVTARPTDRRRATVSDAMICADFVNMLLAGFNGAEGPIDGFEGFGDFRYASYLDDRRPLLLMMEDGACRTMHLRVSFGLTDRREGQILIAIPQERALRALPHITAADSRADPAANPPPDLSDAVRGAMIEVSAILCRRRLTLSELRALAPGRCLSLPRVSLSDALIETVGGQLLARGKLGEVEGCYAIRLQDPDHADAAPVQADDDAMLGQILARRRPSADPDEAAAPIGDLDQPDPFRDDNSVSTDAPGTGTVG